ncbi:DctP family TRAP transporter solute-binding subunit [Bacillus sp. ISL-47]|uniref:DctP family TRAP transporter solute-binding subunit n=1 Tax=Bacillus sp. ISL-47 TaxID=2819130 RepID=UPI001BEC6B06|nr:DctP family TRAP transporter solute-binding subunit [Bacillus sp. ISL-47]MBT2686801.1 DctP family TRAP transporter solute-binding subunit [Bacillus sp. ISL-47]MBT2706846.1 DctP family TRAP transporter solute-binding subunit [Pseudomonas sp. ISL-84]
MKKRFFSLILLSVLMLLVSACGSNNTSNQTPKGEDDGSSNSDKAVELSIGLPGAEDHPFTVAANKFKEVLDDAGGGAFDVKIFPNSQLGGERETAESVRMGSLDMTVVTVDGAMPAWIPETQVFTVPYIIRDREHAYKVLEGEVGQLLTKRANEEGWENLGYWELGVRHFTNNVGPVESPEDLEGLKMRVQESRVWFSLINALKATPTPIAFNELYSALSQGVVDGQENPLPTIAAQKFYEVQKYLSLDGHTYTPAFVLISQKKWASLTDEQKKLVQKAVDETTPYIRNWIVEQEEQLVSELKEKGMVISKPDLEKFREATKEIPGEISDIVPKDLIDKVVNTK